MKKILITLMVLVVATTHLFAQSRTDMDQTVNRFQTLYNNDQTTDIHAMFSDRIKTLLPADKNKEAMTQLNQQAGKLTSYSFAKQEQGLSWYKATFEKATLFLIVSLDKDKKMDAFRFLPYKDESAAPGAKSNISYKSTGGELYGTVLLPEGDKAVPVVLIIAGSGPTDRNGNQDAVKTNNFSMLADSLRKAGIASVRYDKRGVGESAAALKDESKLLFDDMVNDACGFVKMLKADKRFSAVYILGHSEGSLVGMIAATREPVAGYISVAGLAERADKIIVRQIAAQSEGLSLKAAFILDSLTKGQEIHDADPALSSLFRPSVQPYIKSWLKYEPKEVIKKLTIPVLLLQGTTDIQVPAEEAEKLKEAYPDATLRIIKGMNHVLKQAPENREQNMATYNNPTLPLSAGLSPAIVTFVKSIAK